MRTQAQRIIDHLATGRPLTAIDALKRFGCFRLAARILDLRNDGHRITSRVEKCGDKRFASYRLAG
jgi:hypothetical protein